MKQTTKNTDMDPTWDKDAMDRLMEREYLNGVSAPALLQEASALIGIRAKERDTDQERSMHSTVEAFNSLFGTNLTETQGWLFMVLLKAARSKGGDFRIDDFLDGAAYFALAGEAAAKEKAETLT